MFEHVYVVLPSEIFFYFFREGRCSDLNAGLRMLYHWFENQDKVALVSSLVECACFEIILTIVELLVRSSRGDEKT